LTVHLSCYPHQGGHEASSDCGRFSSFEHRDLLWPLQGATLVRETRAFLLPKRYSRLPSNPRDPSPRPMSPGTHRVPCPRYRFDARPPRLGLIGAHLDRQVSSTAARCPPPPATPAQSQRPCRTRASCTACRHHGRASATMCATSAPPTRSSQVGGNCRRPRSPQSSARASVAITSPPRLLRRLTDGISAK
jgi:hypothetical protein